MPGRYSARSTRSALPTSTRKKLLFASVPALVLVGGLAALELGLRLAGWEAASSDASSMVMLPHPTRIWQLPVGASRAFDADHTIGPDGLRTVEAEGDPLIVVTTGDSSIFGHGLPDEGTLHAQLEQALESAQIPVDVYCGGIPGYSTAQSLVLLDEVLWDLEPDLVVIGNMWSDGFEGGFSDAELLEELDSPLNQLRARTATSKVIALFASWVSTAAPQTPSFVNVGWMQDVPTAREARVPLDHFYANLNTMLDQVQQRDTSAVLLEPCARFIYNVYSDKRETNPYGTVMRRVAEERGVPHLWACDALYAGRVSSTDAFIDDLHPSSLANRAYATALADLLRERGWPATKLTPTARP